MTPSRFLLCKLHIRAILRRQTTRARLNALNGYDLPFNLSEVYEQMLVRIDQNIGIRLLHWVFYAQYPLTILELRYALAIDPSTRDLDPDLDLPSSFIIDTTLGLLTVDNERQTVRFTHLTVKDYLTEHAESYFPLGHSLLAEACLTYLTYDAMNRDAGLKRYTPGEGLHPFFKYAASQWGHHAQQQSDEKIFRLARRWLDSQQFDHIHQLRKQVSDDFLSAVHTPLHEVCYFGIHNLIAKTLQSDNPNAADEHNATPLMWAVRAGQISAVQRLLRCNTIDVNRANAQGWTPLITAAHYDYAGITTHLLQQGDLQINAATEYGWTALVEAADAGSIMSLQCILDHPGVDINWFDKNGWTALHAAAFQDHANIVQVLLESPRINVNVTDSDKRTPLYWAAYKGNTQVVHALLHHPDIRIVQEDTFGFTPLQAAVSKGHRDVERAFAEFSSGKYAENWPD
jgi:ankyrin repeat protein